MEDIRIHNLSKEYFTTAGSVFAVRDLSLSVARGSVFGFLGPNGAGKTTTMKMLVGLERATSGEISINGGNPSSIAVRRNIGFMPEAPAFYLYLTGREFLQFICDIFDVVSPSTQIESVLKEVDLLGRENRQIRTYSKGMLQRLGLAQALLNDPQILFLDEPLDGLDPLGRAEIKSIFLGLKKRGKTIFLNSHILADVAEMCDMVGIIDQGKLIVCDTPKEITGNHRDLEDAFVHIIKEKRAAADQETTI